MAKKNIELYNERRQAILDVCKMYETKGLHRPGRPRLVKMTGIPKDAIQEILRDLVAEGIIEERTAGYSGIDPEESVLDESEDASIFPKDLSPFDIGYGNGYDDKDKDETIRRLEAKIRDLQNQGAWLTNSPEAEHTGGSFTLVGSDFHYFDRGQLIHTTANLEDKSLDLIDVYKPHKITIIINGDIVTGSGIYRNQQMENILSTTEQQVCGAIYKLYEWNEKIVHRIDQSLQDYEFVVLSGNHDMNRGEPLTQYFVWGCREFGIPMRYVGHEWVHNAADEGCYNILFEHGYGNSAYSPTSNKMVFETLRKIIGYFRRGYYGDKEIKRITHSHTHWANVGTERAEGLYFDTTGGLHRNDRVNIGANTRPTGWIAYISPPGSSEILNPPTLIHPRSDILRSDMDNPDLENENRKEAARCLDGFSRVSQDLGVMEHVKRTIENGEAV